MFELFNKAIVYLSDINYDIYAILIIVLILIILTMYNKIKYECLKKASEKVAEVETMSGLTGEQKFAIVVLWIEEELPRVFRNAVIKKVIEFVVQYAYNNAFKYAKNYIKRKTGVDIGELVNEMKKQEDEDSDDIK